MQNSPNLTHLTEMLRRHLPVLTKQYQVASLEVFGSYLRHEQHANSDLDLLVTFHESPSLLKFIELENYLSDLLDIKVDLVMKEALKPQLRDRILRETVTV
jgi:predicted nucleotidyltransferase